MATYFKKEFNQTPCCFLLSATYNSYSEFPIEVKQLISNKRMINLVFDAAGSPIEMLNYDLVGTMADYLPLVGAVREPLEYDERHIRPYHECINYIVKEQIKPLLLGSVDNYDYDEILHLINKIFTIIKNDKPVISEYIKHIGKHKKKKNIDNDKELDMKILNKIFFEKIISYSSKYAIIWQGIFEDKSCVIKMVLLNSGETQNNRINSEYFKSNDDDPFRHKDFYDKKPMSINSFKHEVDTLYKLHNLDLAPKIYGSWICNNLYPIHYGFIVMEKLDYTVKQIIQQRSLKDNEKNIIEKTFSKLHENHEMIHGDMKPGNIGVYLDSNNQIKKCLFLDCSKVKQKKDIGFHEFNRLIVKDWEVYKKHYANNKEKKY